MRNRSKKLKIVAVVCTLAFVPIPTFGQHYTQTNLVSDLANVDGQAVAVQDPNLKNAWGLARSASSPWWVNNAGTGTSTLYTGTGAIVAPPSPVMVPNAPGAKGAFGAHRDRLQWHDRLYDHQRAGQDTGSGFVYFRHQ